MNAVLRLPAAALLAAGLTGPVWAEGTGPDGPSIDLATTPHSQGTAADPAPLVLAQADAASPQDAAAPSEGAEHTVAARAVQFEPAIIFIEPGDTVYWENMPTHNVASVEPLIPEGQETFETPIGENVSLTFETEGLVVYKCTPHWGNRMGGIIVVGDPEDPMAIAEEYLSLTEENPETLPARGLLKDLMAELEERGSTG